ncbi:MAG: class I SAM-dependent methyltransferase [Candidatus Kapabacteria bacterium]|nr:class I SAM-dependent methyltransferase [Candidatus Kapabacteria bacterium]MCS7169643.1 class I SAM-dependent methyltransferase [Candidatus Kapabacteria bacterium]MDW7997483.1 class I SAM-dependent methyltransferase [Bacteroidota bacterium]
MLKEQVQHYWDQQPCGTQFTEFPWGTPEFFADVERFRYTVQPFMHRLIGFERYKGKRVLEVGCGLATDLLQFARHGACVTGIDLSPQSIRLARQRFSLEGLPGEFLVADAEQLPFPNASFEVVYSFGVLHHTPNIVQALAEIHRVLIPGGEVILMLYHRHSIHVWLGTPLYIARTLRRQQRLRRGAHLWRTLVELLQRGTWWQTEWVRIYDGETNPLGRSFSRREVRALLHNFQDVRFHLCDPVRRRFPRWINWLNQRIVAPFAGFYLLVRARKPTPSQYSPP